MKRNKIAVSLLSLGMVAGYSAHATELKDVTNLQVNTQETSLQKKSFGDWRAEQNREKYADKTDQIIVTFENQMELMAIETYSTMAKSNMDVSTLSASNQKQVELGKSSLMKLNLFAGQPLSLAKKLSSSQMVFKLKQEMYLDEVRLMANRMSTLSGQNQVEADPKRWPMAQNQPWGISAVQADQVSDAGAGNMTVCIIDSGYDINNPDLLANNHSGTSDSGTGNWFTAGGSHGTHVAGTIAAVNNSDGVVGVLPNTNVNLHIIKVFNEAGWAYSSDLTTAIQNCKNAGAKVVNMSLGGPSGNTSESNAMQSFYDDGMLLIAAAGNDGDSSLSYPASYDSVVSVAAVDETGLHAEFSQFTAQVELSGPGEAVLSTVAGDGRQGFITYGGSTTGDDRVLPPTRFVQQGSSFVVSDINGNASGELASCSRSGSTYSCGNMSGKICVAERDANQGGGNYPEINAAKACADAGAAGVVVYSNSARPGLQNPFLVDATGAVGVPTVSVNRALGQDLVANAGTNATLQVVANTEYAYYNGTSMATPHVAGVAALAWSNNITCTAAEVRNALAQTAQDLDVAGRDNRTGWGMVQTKAASDYMAANCGSGSGGGSGPTALTNGTPVTGLAGAQGSDTMFTLDVPAGATDLSFAMSGGSGDADIYVRFGSAPTLSTYDCRPWLSGNNETCDISNVQEGTYYVMINAYTAFSGVSLTGSFTEPSSGGQGVSGSLDNLSAARNDWLHYTLDVPAGMSILDISTQGGTGDADLYMRFNARPTTSTYDCRPYESGNDEQCLFNNPQAGTWHISIRAYRAFSGLTLNYAYQP